MDPDTIWILVPLTALAIPLIAVIGKVIVKPVSMALMRLADAEQQSLNGGVMDQRLREIDDRLARLERLLERAVAAPSTRPQLTESHQPRLFAPSQVESARGRAREL